MRQNPHVRIWGGQGQQRPWSTRPGRSCVATHIDACVARRRCLPIAMRDSVVRGIDRVDPF